MSNTQWQTYCSACVTFHQRNLTRDRYGAAIAGAADASEKLRLNLELEAEARALTGATRGEKQAYITHLIGGGPGNRIPECPHASEELKEEARVGRQAIKDKSATKSSTATGNVAAVAQLKRQASTGGNPDMPSKKPKADLQQSQLRVYPPADKPFSKAEVEAIRAKALRVTVKNNLPFSIWDNIEFLEFLALLRTQAPTILPSAKVMSGALLQKAADDVDEAMKAMLDGKEFGLSTDGWKSRTKSALNAVCVNVDYKVHTLKLIDMTEESKTGEAQSQQFEKMIDDVENGDGGSSKGQKLLVKKRPHLLAPECWGHQGQLMLGDYFKVHEYAAEIAEKATGLIGWINNHGRVRKIFNHAQEELCQRDPTKPRAFMRLYNLKDALELAVVLSRQQLIEAQVGAAKSTEKMRLEQEAKDWIEVIKDSAFWLGLETILGDLEAICYGININQKDSARADQVLLMIASVYLQFSNHPEPAVSARMTERLEKRWHDCDQLLFIFTLILNPWEMLSRFGQQAGLDHLSCNTMLFQLYTRMRNRPDNHDSHEQRLEKEKVFQLAFVHYLAGTGLFASWQVQANRDTIERAFGRAPLAAWRAMTGPESHELASFAITLLSVMANTAGCERTFSHLKLIQSPHRSRLGKDKLEQMTKVGSRIAAENVARGTAKLREGRKNHKGTEALLEVPRYGNLLEDQNDEDESERGRILVNTREGWRTETAKWIAASRASKEEEVRSFDDEDDDDLPEYPGLPPRLSGGAGVQLTPPKKTLAMLFGDLPLPTQEHPARSDSTEAALMHALEVFQRLEDVGEPPRELGDREQDMDGDVVIL
ncbi:ribonuclease H-like domain-containing protein [Schizophyllum commune]